MAAEAHRVIETVWRMESARLIARLARIVRDVGVAEEMAQDAYMAALQQWPADGIPDNPAAWLMSTAKNRAVDHVRRNKLFESKQVELARDMDSRRQGGADSDIDAALDDDVGDDLLRLIFMTCHPVLSSEARSAITLRLLCGLTTDEIARSFLVSESTIAQRIVRAKKTLTELKVPFEVPRADELAGRLSSVLEVIYLLFNEGYSATAGDDWMRPALCEEAMRLGRIVAELLPNEPEVHGLVALMEIQASRSKARVDKSGRPVLLLDQNRAQWDQLLIHRGLTALRRAETMAQSPGPYTIQAAIAARHARAHRADETNWPEIARLYGELAAIMPSPVVELNRAVAVSMALGPQAGLDIIDRLAFEPVLANYQHLPSVRGELLFKLGRFGEARLEFQRAASLARNSRERDLLIERAKDCPIDSTEPGN